MLGIMDYRTMPTDPPLLVVSTQIVALDRATGATRWRYDLEGVGRRFAVEADRIFVFDSKGWLHCVAVANGQRIGRVELELQLANSMLVDGERLYVSGDNEVVALDLTGRILWRAAVPMNGSHSLGGLGVPGGNLVQPDFSTA